MIAHQSVPRVALLCLLVGLASCGPNSGSPGDSGSDTATGSSGVGGGTVSTATTGAPSGCLATTLADGSLDLQINALNNYAFESAVTLNVIPVAPNTPLNFDWSGLTTDITQQPIAPGSGEVQAVFFTLLDLTPEAFEAKLNANERLTGYAKAAAAFYPTSETSANVYEFGAPGNRYPLPPAEFDARLDPTIYPPEENTYAVLIQDSTDPAHGVRMVQALQLDPESLITDVFITNESSDLTYATDLSTVVPVQVPAGAANITPDWSQIQKGGLNALGNVWEERAVEEVMVGHYSLTREELTEQFLGLENIADQLYRGVVDAGAKLNLNTLTEETSGAAFTGIDGTGTWILALNCNECSNPAPWFLTILQPCL